MREGETKLKIKNIEDRARDMEDTLGWPNIYIKLEFQK